MNRAIEEKNKALALKAFDTLFNKRDYVAAERYRSPDYMADELSMPGLHTLDQGR